MTLEEVQDMALSLATQARQTASAFDDETAFVMTGKQLKSLCKHLETVADTLARLVDQHLKNQ